MRITVTPEKCWDCPEGIHSATLDDIKEINDKRTNKKLLRFIFHIDSLSNDFKSMLVGRNFEPTLEPASDLRRFLVDWLGEENLERFIEDGTFDLDALKSKPATLHIIHKRNESHSKPYVMIAGVEPPKKRILAFSQAADGI